LTFSKFWNKLQDELDYLGTSYINDLFRNSLRDALMRDELGYLVKFFLF